MSGSDWFLRLFRAPATRWEAELGRSRPRRCRVFALSSALRCTESTFLAVHFGGTIHAHRHAAGLLLAAALVTACADDQPTTAPATPSFAEDAGHNAADHFKIDEPIAFQLESPCNGELIDMVGRETGQINAVDKRENLDNGNSVHFEHHGMVVATGTGATTGVTYSLNDVFHEGFESPSVPAPQVAISFRETLHVTSSESALGFSVRVLFHLVNQPPADDVLITKDIESVTCGR